MASATLTHDSNPTEAPSLPDLLTDIWPVCRCRDYSPVVTDDADESDLPSGCERCEAYGLAKFIPSDKRHRLTWGWASYAIDGKPVGPTEYRAHRAGAMEAHEQFKRDVAAAVAGLFTSLPNSKISKAVSS